MPRRIRALLPRVRRSRTDASRIMCLKFIGARVNAPTRIHHPTFAERPWVQRIDIPPRVAPAEYCRYPSPTDRSAFHYMTKLVQSLRLRDLVLLIIGSVIGSGIFLVPSAIL